MKNSCFLSFHIIILSALDFCPHPCHFMVTGWLPQLQELRLSSRQDIGERKRNNYICPLDEDRESFPKACSRFPALRYLSPSSRETVRKWSARNSYCVNWPTVPATANSSIGNTFRSFQVTFCWKHNSNSALNALSTSDFLIALSKHLHSLLSYHLVYCLIVLFILVFSLLWACKMF